MAAAATSIDWLRPPNPPPLEHQFLPPALPRPPGWGDDALRLQQLMLGSPPPAAAARPAAAVAAGASGARDLDGLFDFEQQEPLPSGWERCLDLKSGEVYLVKSDSSVSGARERQNKVHAALLLDLNPRLEPLKAPKISADEDTRVDWSFRWLQEKLEATSGRSIDPGNCLNQQEVLHLTGEEDGRERVSEQAERETLCLDLGLKLTSKHQSDAGKSYSNRKATDIVKSSSAKSSGVDRSQSESLISAPKLPSFTHSTQLSMKEESNRTVPQQQWRWRRGESNNPDVSRESSMATAVCSSCLMYVVLKKTNPTCPRCANPIILDCSSHRPSKRPRLDLTPDDLSLSADFAR